MTAPGPLRVEEDDGVVEIVFDSPPVNQYSEAFVALVGETVRAAGAEARALVVSSAVPRIFAAGGDIPYMASAPRDAQAAYVDLCQATYRAFEDVPCPTIAAIDGACVGGGLELALACDIRIAGRSAALGLPEVTIGILPGGGAIHRLVRTVGQGWARDLLLTGRRVRGQEALMAGLVSRLVDDGEAADAARVLARSLADGAADAIHAIKRLAIDAPDDDFAAGLAAERLHWVEVRARSSAQEGLQAFAEKRAPDFRRADGT